MGGMKAIYLTESSKFLEYSQFEWTSINKCWPIFTFRISRPLKYACYQLKLNTSNYATKIDFRSFWRLSISKMLKRKQKLELLWNIDSTRVYYYHLIKSLVMTRLVPNTRSAYYAKLINSYFQRLAPNLRLQVRCEDFIVRWSPTSIISASHSSSNWRGSSLICCQSHLLSRDCLHIWKICRKWILFRCFWVRVF